MLQTHRLDLSHRQHRIEFRGLLSLTILWVELGVGDGRKGTNMSSRRHFSSFRSPRSTIKLKLQKKDL